MFCVLFGYLVLEHNVHSASQGCSLLCSISARMLDWISACVANGRATPILLRYGASCQEHPLADAFGDDSERFGLAKPGSKPEEFSGRVTPLLHEDFPASHHHCGPLAATELLIAFARHCNRSIHSTRWHRVGFVRCASSACPFLVCLCCKWQYVCCERIEAIHSRAQKGFHLKLPDKCFCLFRVMR